MKYIILTTMFAGAEHYASLFKYVKYGNILFNDIADKDIKKHLDLIKDNEIVIMMANSTAVLEAITDEMVCVVEIPENKFKKNLRKRGNRELKDTWTVAYYQRSLCAFYASRDPKKEVRVFQGYRGAVKYLRSLQHEAFRQRNTEVTVRIVREEQTLDKYGKVLVTQDLKLNIDGENYPLQCNYTSARYEINICKSQAEVIKTKSKLNEDQLYDALRKHFYDSEAWIYKYENVKQMNKGFEMNLFQD